MEYKSVVGGRSSSLQASVVTVATHVLARGWAENGARTTFGAGATMARPLICVDEKCGWCNGFLLDEEGQSAKVPRAAGKVADGSLYRWGGNRRAYNSLFAGEGGKTGHRAG